MENQISIFQNKKVQNGSYYIFELLDNEDILNTNVFSNFCALVNELNKTGINDKYLKLNDNSNKKSKNLIKIESKLFSSIYNTVYNNFLEFLKSELTGLNKAESNIVEDIEQKIKIDKASLIFDKLSIYYLVDSEYKDDFINLVKETEFPKHIKWNGSLSLLKAFIDRCKTEEIKIFKINKGGEAHFIQRNFRPNKNNPHFKHRYYYIKGIQSATYKSKSMFIILDKIFSKS